ncbi:hypothetical protein WS62_10200 [Burkholderia sp. ABCPW 14]|nr:hypothetical protein WS62_10200 [Burkholderia sp. ABCPW 14]
MARARLARRPPVSALGGFAHDLARRYAAAQSGGAGDATERAHRAGRSWSPAYRSRRAAACSRRADMRDARPRGSSAARPRCGPARPASCAPHPVFCVSDRGFPRARVGLTSPRRGGAAPCAAAASSAYRALARPR